ncbi:unnamed protein product [Spirodela intermedia]|uniref:Uncharacterized protein n=1 Tax=Spirodela intermedia TaxID=51605 RepID=A0A7I8KKD1_SPIIN|nr:unnamed protein product [Spirodela intermedia]
MAFFTINVERLLHYNDSLHVAVYLLHDGFQLPLVLPPHHVPLHVPHAPPRHRPPPPEIARLNRHPPAQAANTVAAVAGKRCAPAELRPHGRPC